MPAPETAEASAGPLDRLTEQTARWLANHSTSQSKLARLGTLALAKCGSPPPPTASEGGDGAFEAPVPVASGGRGAPERRGPSSSVGASDDVGLFDQDVARRGPVVDVVREPAPTPPAPAPAALAPAPAAPPTTSTTIAVPVDPVRAAVAISRARFDRAGTVVLAPADALLLAIAAPVAAVLDAPVLVASAEGLPAETIAELFRLQVERLVTIGPIGAPDTNATVEPLAPGLDANASAADISTAAAVFVRAHANTARAFAIADTDEARPIAGAVAAVAALRKFPVMIGAEAARRGAMEGDRRAAVTYLVGRQAMSDAARVPGGFPLPAPSDADVAPRLLQLLKADGLTPAVFAIAPPDIDPVLAAILAGCGGALVPGEPPHAARLFRLG